MTPEYSDFLASKAVRAKVRGLDRTPHLAAHLFPFQRDSVEFALRAGCTGLFLDTGLGKTECQLEFCQKAIEASNSKALILTPLAVAGQTKRRADRWGYEARVIRDQSEAGPGINICNYDRLDKLDPASFGVVSLDEGSILKSFTGKTTKALIAAFDGYRFKMVATATPAPNDHMELGTYSDFLEIMAANEMLSRFFINDTSTASREWRLKGHAVTSFWDWMASWARMAEKPSDLTGDSAHDVGFDLPPFQVTRHKAPDSKIDNELADMFGAPIMSATSMYEIKRQTTHERAKVAAQIVHDHLSRGVAEWKSENIGTRGSERNTPATQNTEKPAKQRRGAETRTSDATGDCGQRSGSNRRTTAPCSGTKTTHAQFVGGAPLAEKASGSTLTTATHPGASGDCSAPPATSRLDISQTTRKLLSAPSRTYAGGRMPSWVLWCDTNDEQDALELELGDLCISIRGSQSADEKEALHEAWIAGARPVLVTKPTIFGFGCDWQHCANMIFIGRTFSYETYYQAVRRCWRFGQKLPVNVHLVVAEGEDTIGRVIDRKAGDHAAMKIAMRAAMKRVTGTQAARKSPYTPNHVTELAPWLKKSAA